MIATRSPKLTPAAINPFATAFISSSYSFAVTACQRSPIGLETRTRSGSKWARSEIRFVKLPATAAGIMAGIVISFMAPRYWLALICARTRLNFSRAWKKVLLLRGNLPLCPIQPLQL